VKLRKKFGDSLPDVISKSEGAREGGPLLLSLAHDPFEILIIMLPIALAPPAQHTTAGASRRLSRFFGTPMDQNSGGGGGGAVSEGFVTYSPSTKGSETDLYKLSNIAKNNRSVSSKDFFVDSREYPKTKGYRSNDDDEIKEQRKKVERPKADSDASEEDLGKSAPPAVGSQATPLSSPLRKECSSSCLFPDLFHYILPLHSCSVLTFLFFSFI